MNQRLQSPPRWAESFLERLLPAHVREEIVGDLREEYVESKLPRCGRLRANLWYVRHVLSFLSGALRGSETMGMSLIGSSVLTAIFMLWLARMELVLRHSLYANRIVLDFTYALICLSTVVVQSWPRTFAFFKEIFLRGVGSLLILNGAVIFLRNARAAHFEGFVFLISLLLVAQGGLMLLTLGRSGENKPPQPAK